MSRILFVLKYREISGDYGQWNYSGGGHLSSGLYNSVRFIVDMLLHHNIEAKMVTVVDNNSIDKEVTHYKPTHCIVEAFWVVPEKFDVLKSLHPNVKWMVRDHSKTEFLAQEGMAFGWVAGYLRRGVSIACNSPESYADMCKYANALGVSEKLIEYLPNYYPVGTHVEKHHHPHEYYRQSGEIHVGCFGAIRPFKNQVSQAIAAIELAEDIKAKLHFHINSNRVETAGSPMLKNLREIFASMPNHKLIEHPWLSHKHFKRLIHRMDFTTQVSYSETFNIVAADSVDMGVPVVGSKEIPWMPKFMQADPSSVSDIGNKMRHLWLDLHAGIFLAHERKELEAYSRQSKQIWLMRFR